jgi:hypothetical protein
VHRPLGAVAPRGHTRDEGWSLRAALQGEVLNHLKPLEAERLQVVSVGEKAYVICQVWIKKVSDKRTNGSAESKHGWCCLFLLEATFSGPYLNKITRHAIITVIKGIPPRMEFFLFTRNRTLIFGKSMIKEMTGRNINQ